MKKTFKMPKRVWEIAEDTIILDTATTYKERGLKSKESLDLAYDALLAAGNSDDRTRGAMETRYYQLKRDGIREEQKTEAYVIPQEPVSTRIEVLNADDLIGSLEQFKNVMLAIKQENVKVLTENEELRAELALVKKMYEGHEELAQNHAFLLRVIEQARRVVRDEDLERMDAKFKMARNGDLERIG